MYRIAGLQSASKFLVLALSVAIATLGVVVVKASDETVPQAEQKTLEQAFRKWQEAFLSDDDEVRRKGAESMLVTRDELTYLFSDGADKLWPMLEKYRSNLLENLDQVAEESKRRGPIVKLEAVNIRQNPDRLGGAYRPLLKMIPADVGVSELKIRWEKSSAGGGIYLCVKGNWRLIPEVEDIPHWLEAMK